MGEAGFSYFAFLKFSGETLVRNENRGAHFLNDKFLNDIVGCTAQCIFLLKRWNRGFNTNSTEITESGRERDERTGGACIEL